MRNIIKGVLTNCSQKWDVLFGSSPAITKLFLRIKPGQTRSNQVKPGQTIHSEQIMLSIMEIASETGNCDRRRFSKEYIVTGHISSLPKIASIGHMSPDNRLSPDTCIFY